MYNSPDWMPWREGDNAATQVRHFEIYQNLYGSPVISRQSPMHHYNTDEAVEFWIRASELMDHGKWPGIPPLTESAAARLEDSRREAQAAISNAFKGLSFGGAR